MPPPRAAARLLRLASPPDDADYVVEDLAEEFESIARERGAGAASRWYWAQTATSLAPLVRARIAAAGEAVMAVWSGLTRGTMVRPNLRYTLRMLARAPGLASIVVVTLGLGIGANTAVFSVVDAVLLKPLPYAAPEQLVSIWETTQRSSRSTVAPGDLGDFIEANHSFAGLGGYTSAAMTLTRAGPPEPLAAEVLTTNLFTVLGVQPAIGRTFSDDDGRPGATAVVILSHAMWRSKFNQDAAILGRTLTLDGDPHVV